MTALLLLLAVGSPALLVARRIAASPTFQILACAFGGWAEHCRNGAELARDDLRH